MADFFDRADAVCAQHSVLEHPFTGAGREASSNPVSSRRTPGSTVMQSSHSHRQPPKQATRRTPRKSRTTSSSGTSSSQRSAATLKLRRTRARPRARGHGMTRIVTGRRRSRCCTRSSPHSQRSQRPSAQGCWSTMALRPTATRPSISTFMPTLTVLMPQRTANSSASYWNLGTSRACWRRSRRRFVATGGCSMDSKATQVRLAQETLSPEGSDCSRRRIQWRLRLRVGSGHTHLGRRCARPVRACRESKESSVLMRSWIAGAEVGLDGSCFECEGVRAGRVDSFP